MTSLDLSAREQKIVEELKRHIDGHSFARAINLLAEMCYLKAEHIEANWQDKTLARLWRREGQRLEGCGGRVQGLVASSVE